MPIISGLDLVKGMISGGEEAVTAFSHLSGGEWFDEAPEYFLTSAVAQSAGRYESTNALLEVNVDSTRREAGASRRGRAASHERRNGRFDVVVYWANGTPRAAVEVKSPIGSASENLIAPDIDRLSSSLAVSKESSLQFGVFLFYASVSQPQRKHESSEHRLQELLDRIEQKAKERATSHGANAIPVRGSIHTEGEEGAWVISSVVIVHPGSERTFSQG